nr:aminotransferase class IV [Amaricoccus sp.]
MAAVLHHPGVRLVETLRWTPGAGFSRLDAHLARLARGAAALGVALRPGAIDAALAEVGAGEGRELRVRLLVDLSGAATVETAPAPPPAAPWRVILAAERLRSDDPWLAIKTTRRPAHDAARAALAGGADEAILLNERGEVCDGTITTVFLDRGAGLLTPPLACGCLPGVLRAELLAAGTAREATLRPPDLAHGRLLVGNALRGLIPARLAEA